MLRMILRALFGPSYRSRGGRYKKPVNETLAYKVGHSITASSGQSKPSQPAVQVRDDVFDASTAQATTGLRVLEGPAYVTDGDTITIKKTQVRLYGIDAPELNHPYGKKAKWAMVHLCKGQSIRAEITDEDEYGRHGCKVLFARWARLISRACEGGIGYRLAKILRGQV